MRGVDEHRPGAAQRSMRRPSVRRTRNFAMSQSLRLTGAVKTDSTKRFVRGLAIMPAATV